MQSFDRMHLHIITLQNELTGLNSVGEDTVFCERGVSLFLSSTYSLNKRCYIYPSRKSFYLLCSLNLFSVSNFILGFWQDCTIKTEPALFFFSFSFSSTKLELFISWCLYFFDLLYKSDCTVNKCDEPGRCSQVTQQKIKD